MCGTCKRAPCQAPKPPSRIRPNRPSIISFYLGLRQPHEPDPANYDFRIRPNHGLPEYLLGGIAFMSMTAQRRLGIWLVCLSSLALIIAWASFSHWRVIGSGSSGNGSWTAGEITSDISWRYWLPCLLCGALGVFFWARSSRKPPNLSK